MELPDRPVLDSSGGPGNGGILRPHGMDLLANGQLYVTEQTGERVTVFQVVH